MDQTTNASVAQEAPQSERKPYNTPALTDFGSFAEITQGNAGVGVDDSIYS